VTPNKKCQATQLCVTNVIIFKICILLCVYNQHIQIPPSMQQLFIDIYSTTYFDPNGSSSGAASLTHSTTELQRLHSHLYIHMVQEVTFYIYSIHQLD
jgi:hypothetical protein